MFPYVRLGPFLVQTPLLALLVGLWISLLLVEREAKRLNMNSSAIGNLVFYSLLAGLVGARLGYALEFPSLYAARPLSLLALTPSTLSPFMGAVVGLLVFIIFVQRNRLPLRPTLDAFAPGLACFMVAVGASHILGGDAYGVPTNVPWAIRLWNENRHPSQFYETLVALIIFLVVRARYPKPEGTGLNFLWTVFLSSGARVFLEAFRGDSVFWPGGLREAQVLALAVMVLCFWWWRKWVDPESGVDPAPSPQS